MKCDECVHARPHHGIRVCRAAEVLDWQERVLRCRVGVHVEIALVDGGLCGGRLFARAGR